ncbi:MAG: GDSL-type esterase/lipase family protein [Candidatus Bathyarchaeia archaeon]|jgi:lysophospholipase L1-like esterase
MKKKLKLIAILIALMMSMLIIARFSPVSLQSNVPDPIRVACVGDSITEITEYPSDLQSLLGANYRVGNFGHSGATVSLNTWCPYMNQSEFEAAMEFQPEIVIIMLGTNDDHSWAYQYNDSFEHDYTALITSFQGLESNPQIWLVKPPPIFSNTSDLNNAYFMENIIPQIQDLANKLKLTTIDVNSAFGNHTDYFTDGVHPNSQGAEVLAKQVYNAINSYDN